MRAHGKRVRRAPLYYSRSTVYQAILGELPMRALPAASSTWELAEHPTLAHTVFSLFKVVELIDITIQ